MSNSSHMYCRVLSRKKPLLYKCALNQYKCALMMKSTQLTPVMPMTLQSMNAVFFASRRSYCPRLWSPFNICSCALQSVCQIYVEQGHIQSVDHNSLSPELLSLPG